MADEISETSAAASSGGNWWSSGGPNSMPQWSCNMNIHSMNMLLPAAAVTQPCSTTALADIQQWSSDIPNSSGGRAGDQDVDNLSNSSTLSHQDLVDSGSALLDSSMHMGHFRGVSNNHPAVWTQVLLGSGEAVQNTSVGNLHEVLYSRAPRQELLEPSDHLKKIHEPEGPSSGWEFRQSFASFQADDHMSLGKPAQIPAPLLYNPQLLDDRLHGGNATLADLGGWSVAPPDQASASLMSRNICLTTFTNSELDLPIPQFDLGRIKQECPNMSNYTNALGVSANALLQGFGPEPDYKNVQEGFSHILESAGKPFLKSMSTHAAPGACCSNINAGEHHRNHHDYNPHGGRWPISANMSTSSQLPVALSRLLPSSPSKQSPGVLTFGTNKQHFDGKQMHNVPAQHRTTGDEARAESCADTKRCSADQSAAGDSIFKRPRLEASSTIPPFKVRKEKLGDRITALQQLVSPFGKTDTASVLLEAIGYIKFLQEQVQVLSTPYMKSGGTSAQGAQDQKGWASSEKKDPEEPKQDLRSRGLCLVPVSCTLHVANDNGADYWTPSLGTGSYR